ncbi:zinc finger protein 616-like [Anthonomus grandis grandis]|uniref:zinc finger protein 616-like n=1 Tax=Anthonomus grandis grandis TaxID=2921223 RepID=UPI002166BF12|nr:zinc finger protein 616-like [Anthonomus grandis grandis]
MANNLKNSVGNAIEIITIDDDDEDDIVIVDNPVEPLHMSFSPKNDFQHSDHSTVLSTNGNTKSTQITKELTFNGQKKTFVLLNSKTSETQKRNEPSSNPVNGFKTSNHNMARVQCPRCKANISIESFRQHMDACSSRIKNKFRTHNNSLGKTTSNGSVKKKTYRDDGPPDLSDSVYSDFIDDTKQIKGLTYNSESKIVPFTNAMNISMTETATETSDNLIKPVKYTARKSTSNKNQVARRYSIDLDIGLEETNSDKIQKQNKQAPDDATQRTRSKSYCFGADSSSNTNSANGKKNLSQSMNATKSASENNRKKHTKNDTEEVNHANQFAYYKKFLEVRNKSGLSKSQNKPETENVSGTKPEINLNESLDVSLLQDNTFACTVCSFTTDKQRILMDHVRNHRKSNKKIYRCAYCDQKYTKHMLYSHIHNVHPGQKFGFLDDSPVIDITEADEPVKFNCLKCSHVAESETDLRAHNKQHKPDASAKMSCNLCSFTASAKSLIDRHMKTHENRPNDPILQCPWCDYRGLERSLRSHKTYCPHKNLNNNAVSRSSRLRKSEPSNKTTDDEPVANPLIKRNAKSLSSVKQELNPEIESCKKDVMKPNDKKMQYKCDLCSFTSFSLINIQNSHRDSHKFHPMVKCVQCCEFESTPRCVKIHQLTCNGKYEAKIQNEMKQSLFKCSMCNFSTSLRIKLNSHIKKCHSSSDRESNTPPHQTSKTSLNCKECSFKANSLFDLTAHNQKPHVTLFQCGLCSFLTLENVLFNKHINSHTKNSVVKCGKCCYRSTQSYLTAHLKIHNNIGERTEDGKFKCDLCSHGSSSLSKLKIHRLSHKTQAFQKCPLCLYKSTQFCVRRHLKFSHQTNFNIIISASKVDIPEMNPTGHSNLAEPPILERMDISEETKKPDLKLQCKFCSKVFKTTSVLTKHINDKHKYVKAREHSFKCKLCSAEFLTQNALNRHFGVHKINSRMLTCQFCDYMSIRNQVQKHEANCPQKTTLHTNSAHIRDIAEFRCTMCSYSTKLRIKLKMHLKAKHGVDSSPVKEIDSTLPDRTAPPKLKRQRTHDILELNPSKKRKLIDDTIQIRTRSKSLSEAKKRLSQDSESKISCANDQSASAKKLELRSFSCPICSYSTNLQAALTSHLTSHKNFNNVILQCHYCGIKGTDSIMKRHLCSTDKPNRLIAPMKVRLDCDKCSFTTYFPLDFFEHRDNCTANKNGKSLGAIKSFKCEYCSFTSFWQYLIERHMDSHTVLKLPIEQCPNCDFHSTPVALMAHRNKCIKREK